MSRPNRLPLADYPARRVGLVKPSALGDIVHSLPVLRALRVRYPHAHITWVVNRAYEPLLRGHPDLDATLPFDRGALRGGLLRGCRALRTFLRGLRRCAFDLVIDLQGLLRSGLIAAASGAPRRVGLSSAREGARWFYTDRVPVPRHPLHAVDRYWLVAEALGVGHLPKTFFVPIAQSTRRWAREMLTAFPRPWVIMSLGTRWETKRWPVAHFTALARRIRGTFGGAVVLVGGPDESALAREAEAQLGGPTLNLAGQTGLPQLAAVLECADLVLANDSGPLHLAAALGRPVAAPYTCTSPWLTGPYGQTGQAVLTSVRCAASYLKRCGRMDCMAELTPDRLWPVVERVLAGWQRQSA